MAREPRTARRLVGPIEAVKLQRHAFVLDGPNPYAIHLRRSKLLDSEIIACSFESTETS